MKEIEQKIITALLLLVFLAPFFSSAQIAPEDTLTNLKRASYLSDNPKLSELDLLVDSVVRGFMQSPQNCGLSIAVSNKGKNSYYNYGEVKRNSGIPLSANSVFEIGSLTAGFTGFLLAKAVNEKKLSLEDDIRKFLPGEFKNLQFNKNPIRLKHLANHSSGLPQLPDDLTAQENYDATNPYKNYSREQIFIFLQRVQLTMSPGYSADYSSLGLALLGIILEKVYGSTYEALLVNKIMQPLGLASTFVTNTQQPSPQIVAGYSEEGIETVPWTLDGFKAAGGLKASPKDLLQFLDAQHSETDAAIKLAMQLLSTGDGKKTSVAWLVDKTKQGNTLFYQSGGTFGSGGFIGLLKEQKSSVVVIANSGRNMDYIAIALLNYLQQ